MKNKIKARNEKDKEEVYTKGTLKYYSFPKDGIGVDRYEVDTESGECEIVEWLVTRDMYLL